jgi:hypothetical protein
MRWAVANGLLSEKMSLAMNPNTPIDLLELMAEEGGSVADAAKSHRKLHSSSISEDPKSFFENTVKKAIYDMHMREANDAWESGWIGPGQWLLLAPSCRLHVLGIKGLEKDWLAEYSDMLFHVTQLRAVHLQQTPTDLTTDNFKKLSRSNLKTRIGLAKSTSTPIEVLTTLAEDKKVEVRCCVASNPATPPDLLELMAQSEMSPVRGAVASNPRTPRPSLEALAKDEISRVREAVASNPLTPKPSLDALAKDDEFRVRRLAAVSLSSPELFFRICSEFEVLMLKEKASFYRSNEGLLKIDEVQKSGLIKEFLADEVYRILEEPETSLVANIMRADNSIDILDGQVFSPEGFGGGFCDPQDFAEGFFILAVRLLGLSHPRARTATLLKNVKSTDWLDRLAIARNPSCPQNIRSILKRDGHQMVAKMARAMDLSESEQENSNQNTLPDHGEDSHMEDVKISSPCPNCNGTVKEDNGNYGCRGVEGAASGCGFSFNKTQAGRPFKPAEVELLLREHKSGLLRGFISKAGKPFNAEMVLRFDEAKKTCRVVFDFVKDKKPEPVALATAPAVDGAPQPSLGACPKCGAAVHAHGTNYVCANSLVSPAQAVPSCDFKTGQVILQQAVSAEQLGKLLTSGRTDLLDGFISARTQKAFKAMLVWDAKAGKVNFEFESKARGQ